MSTASGQQRCPKCGGPIGAEAPQGLCPTCLLAEVSAPTESGEPASEKMTPPAQAELAAAFPQLEVLELIGQGGMGFVFKARQPKLDRHVALKILAHSQAADPAFAERFTREGRLLARLNHPNIVSVHDFGQANGFFYLLMEYVDGVNLRQAMHAGRFTPAQTLGIVPKICEALQYAHNEGVLHRDIKPENILLDAKGHVKIADFGIAKLVGETRADAPLTGSGTALGTPHYMAPEQIEQPADVDHRADIYSLGVVFYELLTGELPLGRFAPPSGKTAVAANVDEIVMRALAKERESRQQSATEFKTQVETAAAGEPTAPTSSPAAGQKILAGSTLPATTTNPWPRRVFWLVAALFLIPLVLVAIFISLWALGRDRPEGITRFGAEQANNAVVGRQSTIQVAAKTVVLSGATNRVVGTANTQTVSVKTDTTVYPGETLWAVIRHPDGRTEHANTSSSIVRRRKDVQTGAWFTWFIPDSFSREEVEALVTQLEHTKTERPIELTSGEPFALFSITNQFGAIVTGLLEFQRFLPEPNGSLESGTKPHASVRLRPYRSANLLLFFEADVPPGYSLQGTARASEPDTGESWTSIAHSNRSTDYHCSWRLAGVGPAQLKEALDQMSELAERGALSVPLGEPFRLFSVTNETGQVSQGYLELFAPSSTAP